MIQTRTLPLVPLRGVIVLPYLMVHLDVGREFSINAVNANKYVCLATQKNADIENPDFEDIYHIGIIAEIKQVVKLPDGHTRVLVEGQCRATILDYDDSNGEYIQATVEEHNDNIDDSIEMASLTHSVVNLFEDWVKDNKKMPAEAVVSVALISDSGRLADLIASHINLTLEKRQEILNCIDVKERLELLYKYLLRELEIQEMEKKISARVKNQIEKLQKEHYLHEKIRAIHKELGDDSLADVEEFRNRLEEGDYPDEVKKVVEKELKRMERVGHNSAESGVIYTYIDTLLNLPWYIKTTDHININSAAKVLDKEHYGLDKVKERILDYLAVRKLKADMKAPILCLVGPPGVGKTSLATSVAKAIGRNFVRASLGGVRDEAEIRGHRRTYIGAMPGRIIDGIKKSGSRNPVFLLDEVDKMASDYKGDPTAALLEVLDPAQNNTFSDHYIEVPFDLSDVLWIVTANNLGAIPRPLRDRMEIITISSYTEVEKLEIAKRHLFARQRSENGLNGKQIRLGAGVLQKLINEYTRESGVRELERILGKVCRKAVRNLVENEEISTVSITVKNLTEFAGKVKFPQQKSVREPEIGLCTGMAWTQVGGDILLTEVNTFPGNGKLILTGKLGDVMKESAQAALSYIRSRHDVLGIDPLFHAKLDIHIHFPEGAVPKDGPSAGITIATALTSALTRKKVRSDVAMTGEITIRGRVLAIGGLKEKVLAAYREGIKTIILPDDNERDIEEIPENVREKLEFIPVKHVDEVLKVALLEEIKPVDLFVQTEENKEASNVE